MQPFLTIKSRGLFGSASSFMAGSLLRERCTPLQVMGLPNPGADDTLVFYSAHDGWYLEM